MLAEEPVEAGREVSRKLKCENSSRRGFGDSRVVEVVHVSSSLGFQRLQGFASFVPCPVSYVIEAACFRDFA